MENCRVGPRSSSFSSPGAAGSRLCTRRAQEHTHPARLGISIRRASPICRCKIIHICKHLLLFLDDSFTSPSILSSHSRPRHWPTPVSELSLISKSVFETSQRCPPSSSPDFLTSKKRKSICTTFTFRAPPCISRSSYFPGRHNGQPTSWYACDICH